MKLRSLALMLLYAALLVGSWMLSGRLTEVAGFYPDLVCSANPMMLGISALYVLTAAIPFVPGAEIGLALLAMFGAEAALLVYLCMVSALLLSFLVGRFVPSPWLIAFLRYLGLKRAGALVSEMNDLPLERREELLFSTVQNRYARAVLQYRYLAFAIALNVPGNSLAGGGGGLALVAGMSRLFNIAGFVATLLVAIAPLPLLVFFTGYQP